MATFKITIFHKCYSFVLDQPDDIEKNYKISDPGETLTSAKLFTASRPDCSVQLSYYILDFDTEIVQGTVLSSFPFSNLDSVFDFRTDSLFYAVDKAAIIDPAKLGKRMVRVVAQNTFGPDSKSFHVKIGISCSINTF